MALLMKTVKCKDNDASSVIIFLLQLRCCLHSDTYVTFWHDPEDGTRNARNDIAFSNARAMCTWFEKAFEAS